MQFLRLSFKNREGRTLAARLDLPIDEKPVAYALFAHCFTCSKNLNAVVFINRALTMKGIAVMRFDFTGIGESEGDFSETNFSTNVADLVDASNFLSSNFEAPRLLIGHSMGGAAVLQAASRIPSSVAVATIAAPSDPSDVGRLLGSKTEEIDREGEAEIILGGRAFRLRRQFLEDLEGVRMADTVRNLDRALLVLHSPADEVVEIRNAVELFQTAKQPKSMVSLGQADHLLSDRNDSIYAGTIIGAWAGRYLGIDEDVRFQRDLRDNRVVARIGKAGYQTEIKANEHRFVADEPIALGGADTGASPYDYLVAALGACTSMTIRMYADRKGWPVEEVVVRLKHEKIHAEDCEDCGDKDKKIDHIDREIEVMGPLSGNQRERILQIANRCPVHRTLRTGVQIDSRLKE